jgi:hypothetical protein
MARLSTLYVDKIAYFVSVIGAVKGQHVPAEDDWRHIER